MVVRERREYVASDTQYTDAFNCGIFVMCVCVCVNFIAYVRMLVNRKDRKRSVRRRTTLKAYEPIEHLRLDIICHFICVYLILERCISISQHYATLLYGAEIFCRNFSAYSSNVEWINKQQHASLWCWQLTKCQSNLLNWPLIIIIVLWRPFIMSMHATHAPTNNRIAAHKCKGEKKDLDQNSWSPIITIYFIYCSTFLYKQRAKSINQMDFTLVSADLYLCWHTRKFILWIFSALKVQVQLIYLFVTDKMKTKFQAFD